MTRPTRALAAKRPTAQRLEMELAHEAAPIVERLGGRLPSAAELMQLSLDRGVDLATVVFYRAVLASPLHSGFVRAVMRASRSDAEPARSENPFRYEAVILPSSTPGYGPSWGSFVDDVRRWARDLGYATDVPDVWKGGSIFGNARALADYVAEKPLDAKLVFVTFGRGALEMRAFLQKRGRAHPDLAKVKGWINVAGAFGGVAAYDRELEGPLSRAWTRAKAGLLGRSYLSYLESSSRHAGWREPFQAPSRLLTVNLVPFPMRWHLPLSLRGSFDALSRFGPNDGAVLLSESMARPGLICPAWGLHHASGADEWRSLLTRAMRVALEALERPQAADEGRRGRLDLSVERADPDPELRARLRAEDEAAAKRREAERRARRMVARAREAAVRREEALRAAHAVVAAEAGGSEGAASASASMEPSPGLPAPLASGELSALLDANVAGARVGRFDPREWELVQMLGTGPARSPAPDAKRDASAKREFASAEAGSALRPDGREDAARTSASSPSGSDVAGPSFDEDDDAFRFF